MKEMLKAVKVTMVVGVLVIGIQADVAKQLESTSSFDLLCNVMQATTGVYSALGNSQLDVVEEKVNELGLIINKVFFGSNWSGSGGGIWSLPENFTAKTPKRSAVCGSNSDSERMPSASDSMASAFLCLCVPTIKSGKDMCELHYDGNEKWSEDLNQNVKNVFRKVWDEGFDGLVIKKCDVRDSSIGDLEQERQNLEENLTKIEGELKNKAGILSEEGKECEGKFPCANVTLEPAWLKLLRTIKEITSITKPPEITQEPETEMSNFLPATQAETVYPPDPASSYVPVQAPKHETREAPQPQSQPKPNEKHHQPPPKQVEDHQVPELNETSSSLINSPNWPLWAALLT